MPRSPFAGQEQSEIQNSRLGCGISGDAREWQVGGDTGKINDAPFAALRHAGTEFLAGQQHAADQVHVEIGPPILQFDLFKLELVRHGHFWIVAAGGIDQNGGWAECFLDCAGRSVKTLARNGVGREKLGLSLVLTDALGASLAALGVAPQHCDLRPCLGQAFGHLATQNASAANNHRNLTSQIEHFCHASDGERTEAHFKV